MNDSLSDRSLHNCSVPIVPMTLTSMQGSDNDERESSRAASLVLNSTRDNSENNQRREPLSSIEARMLKHTGDKIGGTTEIRNAILNMGHAAKKLKSIIGVDDEVHVFISSSSNDSKTSELFAIVSKFSIMLFVKVLWARM